jgi:hypothetical protein
VSSRQQRHVARMEDSRKLQSANDFFFQGVACWARCTTIAADQPAQNQGHALKYGPSCKRLLKNPVIMRAPGLVLFALLVATARSHAPPKLDVRAGLVVQQVSTNAWQGGVGSAVQ